MVMGEGQEGPIVQQLICSHNPGVDQPIRELAVTRGNSKNELNIKQSSPNIIAEIFRACV